MIRAIGNPGRILPARQIFSEMHPALAADRLQPFQFGERIGVVVDAQVEIGPFLLAVNQKRGRLLAALVAARGFAGAHRRDQASRERHALRWRDRRARYRPARGCPQACCRQSKSRCPRCARTSRRSPCRYGRRSGRRVHDMQLPAGVSGVRRDQGLDNIARRASLAQQLQTVDAIIGIDQRLGRDAADAGRDMGHARAHREELRRDRYSELAGGIVSGNDRPGHLGQLLASGRVALHAAAGWPRHDGEARPSMRRSGGPQTSRGRPRRCARGCAALHSREFAIRKRARSRTAPARGSARSSSACSSSESRLRQPRLPKESGG